MQPAKVSQHLWRPLLSGLLVGLAFLMVGSSAWAKDVASALKFEVVGGEKEKPIENASVYIKFIEERTLRPDKRIEWRAKTNREGRAVVKDVRRGKVLVQVVASGWKTYGKYLDITQDQHSIRIKLERPRRWY